MAAESTLQSARARKRAARENGEGPRDTRAEILLATERVLAHTSLGDLSIERIVQEAGVTRRTFYSYFASKFDVVRELHASVIDEFYALMRPFLETNAAPPDPMTFRTMVQAAAAMWQTHVTIGRAVYEQWHSDPMLGAQWLNFVERFADGVGAEIDRQRAAGLAPPGPESRELAASLLWITQELVYVATAAGTPNVLTETGVAATLEAIWTRTIYGSTEPPNPAKPHKATKPGTDRRHRD